MKGHQGNSGSTGNSGTSASSNVAAMLAANGYSAAFPFLHHLANSNANSASQQQQLAAAAAALGLPGLPSSRYVMNECDEKKREKSISSLDAIDFS